MPADTFLDTNVIVYAFDAGSKEKQERARALLAEKNWMVSWQVVQEFCNVALHRFEVPLKPEDMREYVALKLWPRCCVLPGEALYRSAIDLHARFGYRFYDCLIIASALAGGTTRLLSEDLQHGQKIGPLQILNPFTI